VPHLAGKLELQQPADDVVDDEGPEVADVGGAQTVGPAVVEAEDAVGVRGAEFADLAGERVEELDGHRMGGEERV
jgi:hypothetical protein